MTVPRSIIIILSLFIAVLLVSAAGKGLLALSKKGNADNNYALIIGIGNYDSWAKLKSPAKDAEEIARILIEKYDFKKKNVVLLTDHTKEKPTRVNILTHIDHFVGTLTPEDNLLIFFSGQSTEDEKGETYWIPIDGKQKTKFTWLKHAELCKEFFSSQDFKAKSFCIITDSLFSGKLIKKTAITLSPYDLRYSEKITEKALNGSREVFSFGDNHWPGSKRTEGFGLFTYYFRKALLNNWLKVIDLENLLFDEESIFQISKIAGTKLLRGRLKKAPMEKGGQFVITRLISPPVIDVVDTNVSPAKGYQGDKFIVEATTSGPAFEVYIEAEGRRILMEGSGTEWKQGIKVASLGTSQFKVIAANGDDIEGRSKTLQVTTMKRAANLVNVTDVRVTPKKGWGGNPFRFRATTDGPAKKVTLLMHGNRFQMEGSDTKWFLSRRIDEAGTLDYSIIAANENGAEGQSKGGILIVKEPLVNIVEVKAAPGKGYAGDEFLITAQADRSAGSVYLKMDGVTYEMEGSKEEWHLRKKIQDIGKKTFTVIAKNVEGSEGLSQSGSIVTEKKPVAIPDITTVAVTPERPYANQTVAIRVNTTAPADEVYMEIDGQKHVMEGSGTEWKYLTQIASVGAKQFKVTAINEEGQKGTSKTGNIVTRKRPLPLPDIASVSISPKKPLTEETFAIRVKTSAPAHKVYMEIDGKKYPMEGSGTEWKYLTQMAKVGTNKFRVSATNKDGKNGLTKDGTVTIAKRAAKAVDVVTAAVLPQTGLAGADYVFKATTSTNASSVAVIIEDKRFQMTGFGTDWLLKKTLKDFGTLSYAIVAKNKDGVEGGSKIGTLTIRAPEVKVVDVKTIPATGFAGDQFLIDVKTDNPASTVSLEMDGVTYKMQGSGTKWHYKKKIPDVGKKTFTVIAKNLEGIKGLSTRGDVITKKRRLIIPDVASVDAGVVSPGKGYTGDKFLIKATTSEPSEQVYVEIGGEKFPMAGSGTRWEYMAKIDKAGTSKYTVTALNREGKQGHAKSGDILVKKRPVLIPDVASVAVSAVSPGEGYAGDNFLIKVNTSAPSEQVFVQIEGKKFPMEGAGTQWKYIGQIDKLGISKYEVIALNKEGKQGRTKTGEITTTKRPTALVNVARAEVIPKQGYAGGSFKFQAKTDVPAKGVTLVVGKKRYKMTGSNTDWSLSKKIEKIGTRICYMVATNEDGVEGGSKTAEFIVAELRKRYKYNKDGTMTDIITGEVKKRFMDNGDGTVTDLSTNLMWLKSPKQIAVNYKEAQEYCQNLKLKDYEGWRLPTVAEWKDIIDKSRQNPSLPPGNPFSNVPTQIGYWSKTKHKFGPMYVYQVSLWYGKTAHLSKKKKANVWPVRYAEIKK